MGKASPRASWWDDHPFLKLGMVIVSAVNIVLFAAVYYLGTELTKHQTLQDGRMVRLARAQLVQAGLTGRLTGAMKDQTETIGLLVDGQGELTRVGIALLRHARETSYTPVVIPPAQDENENVSERAVGGETRQLASSRASARSLSSWVLATDPVTETVAWPAKGTINSPFGYRWGSLHPGLDIGVPYGTAIRAALSGRVSEAGWSGGYGNMTVIEHDNGLATAYAHQSRIVVRVGQRVTQGQVIGYVGSTGFSTGAHLHFEVRVRGNPVDPMRYLPH